MLYFILVVLAVTVAALIVRTERLARKVNAIDEGVAAIDDDAEDAFGLVGEHIGKLTARADRFEIQLGGADNSQAQAPGADVLDILDEAQVWAAASAANDEDYNHDPYNHTGKALGFIGGAVAPLTLTDTGRSVPNSERY